jgi:predicted transcriptional regulator
MNSRIKQYILIAVVAAAGYFIMSNHFIFNGADVRLLKKSELHLHYTFYSIKQKKPKVIMKIDYLREAGIGDLLVDMGIINEEEKSRLESKYY